MKKLLSVFAIFGILLTGCTVQNSVETVPQIELESSVIEITDNTESTTVETTDLPTTDFNKLNKAVSYDLSASNWTTDIGPYVELNGNVPYFTESTSEVFEEYSELDSLGRCGVAYANVCVELQPTEKREGIGMIKPSGWQTSNYNEYPGLVDGNYLYNRCHLIGFQLAGENANARNLITGTRYLNVTGMLPFENMVDDYLENNPDNHVLYRVTPSYIGNDLVAQGVVMEAWSVEDNGALHFNVWCYNVQPSITINYADGTNFYSGQDTIVTETSSMTTDTENTSSDVTYILNVHTKKIHTVDCGSVTNMKEENREETHKSIEELEAEGYTCCGSCKPQ